MVRFILGRAGKGKTRCIFNDIAGALKEKSKEGLILLVPEQYTLQAERDLIATLNLPGLIHVEVMSITRLAERVFDEVGGRSATMIDDQGRQMAVMRSLHELRSRLTVYQRASRMPGFAAQCSELISEFKQNLIRPEDLEQLLNGMPENRILAGKLHDIMLIYRHFDEFMNQGGFMDADDYLLLLMKKLEQAEFLKNCSIWVDSFTTFSPVAIKIICQLMRICRHTSVTLCLDYRENCRDREMFRIPGQTLARFRSFCRTHGIEEQCLVVDPEPADRNRQTELLHLEKEIMAFPAHSYEQKVEALEIINCVNIYHEVDIAARKIISMARDRGWRWKDMAVVCGDIDTYGIIISRTFKQYGIPCFLDLKRSIINNPLVRCILSTIDVILGGYCTNHLIAMLKTGLTDLKRDEWETLENYALQYGINRGRWKEPFRFGELDEREKNEKSRLKLIEPLLQLEKSWDGAADCRAIAAALYQSMQEQGMGERLQAVIAKQIEEGEWETALENAQIWNIVWETMDQLLLLAGELKLTLEEVRQLLETGFRSYELAIIPPMVDQVLIGNIGRSKSQDVKALFILGCNDGIIPSNMPPEGLLNQEERGELFTRGLELGWDRASKIAEETFLIYNTFAKPADYLGISYPMADGEGRALRPSLLIRQIRRLFPRLVVESELSAGKEAGVELISTPGGTFKYLVENLAQIESGEPSCWRQAYEWFAGNIQWNDMLNSAEAAYKYRNHPGKLPHHLLSRLYKKPIHTSVSGMEEFIRCPFAHFVRFGLRAQDRKNYAIEPPDIGDFFHTFLHRISLQVERLPGGWHKLDYTACQELSDKILDEMIPEYGNRVFESSHRYRFLSGRLKRMGRRVLWTLSQELQRGRFEPEAYEVRFGSGGMLPAIEVKLASGETVLVEGRIDRVDILRDQDDSYLRIIDYKTGNRDLSLSDVYYGLNLQLLVYMKAALAYYQSGSSPVKPAGLFFFHIEDPLVYSDERIKEKVEALAARELGLKGLILEDLKVIRFMDQEFEGSSTFLPVSLNKDQTVSAASSALDPNSMALLMKHVDGILTKIGSEITSGKIDIEPVKSGGQTACQKCRYQSICQFDTRIPGNRYRNLRRLTREEVLQRIAREQEGKQE